MSNALSTFHVINMATMKTAIRELAVGMDQPLMFWGSPGIGKTQGVTQVCNDNGYILVDIRLGQYDSVDLRGFPKASDDETRWLRPSTMPFVGSAFPTDVPIVMFLDEINAGTPPVLGVAYQLVEERRIGEHRLLDNVHIIAAGNREGDKGVTNRMPLPLANRFTHFELGVSVDEACMHYTDIGLPPIFVAFLQFRKPLINTFDPSKADKAFATPRSIEKAARYYMNDRIGTEMKMASMAGAVGQSWAGEFWGFELVWKDVGQLMVGIRKNPEKADIPSELSTQYALAVSISGEMNRSTVGNLHKYLKRMSPEFTVLAWQLALRRPTQKPEDRVDTSPEFLSFSKDYAAVWQN